MMSSHILQCNAFNADTFFYKHGCMSALFPLCECDVEKLLLLGSAGKLRGANVRVRRFCPSMRAEILH